MTTLLTQPSGNVIADDDHLYVCCACGKTSTTAYGFDDAGASTASPGWDESCMMNAQLVLKAHCRFSPGGRVIDVVPPAVGP
jgi:hypothetical protein